MSHITALFHKYTHQMSEQSKGIAASILCSMLFACIPAYVQIHPDMGPSLIEGGDSHWLATQRIIWSTILFFILLFLTKRLPLLWESLKKWRKWPKYITSAVLVAPQYWLFVWAPANGETLNLALGYFTMPIVMILIGCFYYKDSLSKLQKVACYFALAGTLYAYVWASGLSWVVLVVALGYPIYFMFRKTNPMPTDIGLAVDHIMMLPWAILSMFYLYPAEHFMNLQASSYLFYLGLAIVSVTPMLLYLFAYSKLPVSLFGLMGYVEPTFIFIVGLLIGNSVRLYEVPTYLFISCALVVVVIDGFKRIKASKSLKREQF
ncbi:EamA family transporter RarD [Vibrio sp. Isolate31]|uniref:EamA family transporter RarD n=1 Tax=unclassified Vibrio TaxID=2614977 RepID=UPI001EFE4599|nr:MULTISPECIES: EamA family transporter RarD [unclassified Vibrio]MCG9555289.1 EamA family transporter RarD [Vibrio sp. Isolate32]MCG9601527.1 EamA family transporter RarD [Vibrio sp. Isolate31]